MITRTPFTGCSFHWTHAPGTTREKAVHRESEHHLVRGSETRTEVAQDDAQVATIDGATPIEIEARQRGVRPEAQDDRDVHAIDTAVRIQVTGKDASTQIHGLSTTEPCVDWTSTEQIVHSLASAVRERRAASGGAKKRARA